MKVLTVVGARPQFIKSSMLSKAFQRDEAVEEIIVHTGQHYDPNMSAVFFDILDLPKPRYSLNVGSGTHGVQTGRMLMELEEIMIKEVPDLVLVYGDTNSTLAGALAATKLHIPIAHVEAGLRSYNKLMPEEINRIITDHLSTLLFCPTDSSVNNLKNEGLQNGIIKTGDVMYDAIQYFSRHASLHSEILQNLKIKKNSYYLATIHRAENTDVQHNLQNIITAIGGLDEIVVFPVHPRTKNKLELYGIHERDYPNILFTKPLHYFDMMSLLTHSKSVLTDSGGLQKEACMLQVPCITLRKETEWTETIESGWNRLVDIDTNSIQSNVKCIERPNKEFNEYGDGKSAQFIYEIIIKWWKDSKFTTK